MIANRLTPGLIGIALLVAALAGWTAPARAESGFSGLHVQGMSARISNALGLKSTNGVLVQDVALGGPADQAGIRRGDLILEYAGKTIDSFETMIKTVGTTKAGQKVKVGLLREGKPMTLTMTLGKWTAPWRITKSAVASLPASGLTLATLTDKLRKGFGLRWGSVGVVVTLVDPDRTDITLRRGDLIIQVNQEEVWDPAQVVEKYNAAKKAARKGLLLLVERVNGFQYMLLPVR